MGPREAGDRGRARARDRACHSRGQAAGGCRARREPRSTGWSAGLPDYTPARVEQITGVAAKKVERLAHTLVELQPSVAFIGGPPLAHTNGLFHALAVNALNALLGGVGQPGGVFFTPGNPEI